MKVYDSYQNSQLLYVKIRSIQTRMLRADSFNSSLHLVSHKGSTDSNTRASTHSDQDSVLWHMPHWATSRSRGGKPMKGLDQWPGKPHQTIISQETLCTKLLYMQWNPCSATGNNAHRCKQITTHVIPKQAHIWVWFLKNYSSLLNIWENFLTWALSHSSHRSLQPYKVRYDPFFTNAQFS